MIRSNTETDYLNVTINTTEDCNLRCKYCYEINKNPKSMDLDTCKKFIDLILFGDKSWRNKIIGTQGDYREDKYVFDFIGGDSLMNVNLLDQIFKYINTKISALEDSRHYFSISTNGTLFKRKEVRDFCEKWKNNLKITVSIDGCPEIHDLNRVYPDGRGSMKDILECWSWYQKTFPEDSRHTKATCNRDSIPYLYKSLKFMHEELGLTDIFQNFIMEDMHLTDADLKELDKQLELCTKYVADHQNDLCWSMIDIDKYILKKDMEKSQCGSGIMPTLGINGDIYPCHRWLPHTQATHKGEMCVGCINEGFTNKENFTRVQEGGVRKNCTKDPKCLECEFEPACSYCIAGCYSEFGEFKRTTYICEVTKLMCKWSKIYWEQYFKGDLNERIINR